MSLGEQFFAAVDRNDIDMCTRFLRRSGSISAHASSASAILAPTASAVHKTPMTTTTAATVDSNEEGDDAKKGRPPPMDDRPRSASSAGTANGDVITSAPIAIVPPPMPTSSPLASSSPSSSSSSSSLVHMRNEHGFTALHLCALRNYAEIASVILSCGGDVTARTRYGATALHLAAQYGSFEVVQRLVAVKVIFKFKYCFSLLY